MDTYRKLQLVFVALAITIVMAFYYMIHRQSEYEKPTFELERNHLIDSLKLEAQIETRFWKDEFNRINKELYRLEQEIKEINKHYEQVFDSINNADANDIAKRLSGIRFEPDSI